MDLIRIRGARTHNLQNLDLDLPRNQLIVITGPSGSGKSSLAFDTLFAEGQRRYVESLSAYARQFLALMEKPDVDLIEGLSPAIAIDQKTTSHNPRSTVGTVTEIHDYLRLLFARAGTPHCPEHGNALEAQTITQMVDQILAGTEERRLMVLAPVVRGRKGQHRERFAQWLAQGLIRARIDGTLVELAEAPELDAQRPHHIELVIDRLKVRADSGQRLAESLETALRLAEDLALVVDLDGGEETLFSARYACPHCGFAIQSLEPRLFSFNNPAGACPKCDGLGVQTFFDPAKIVQGELSLAEGAIRGWDQRNSYYYPIIRALAEHYDFDLHQPFARLPKKIQDVVLQGSGKQEIRFRYPAESGREVVRSHPFEGVARTLERRYRETESLREREELGRFLSTRPCPECGGARLNAAARHVRVADRSLHEINAWAIRDSRAFFDTLTLPGHKAAIAEKIGRELRARLGFLVDVGLDYLSLARSADTLSGGESQRIRLASQIGSGLTGVMYILDEPSIGLHQRDNDRLLATLRRLRDLGNTVIVVEHDEDAMRSADWLVDLGPGAGRHGGQLVAAGPPADVMTHPDSLTGAYLSGRLQIERPIARHTAQQWLTLRGCHGHNLQHVDLHLPLGVITCVTGVSGSGKSTLILDTLQRALARALNGANDEPAPFQSLEGLDAIDKIISIDQAPIGRTPRSNPATYTGLLTPIRELFAGTAEARARGYAPGRFSFNIRGGRCEACQGEGVVKVEMHFMPDIYVPCDLCAGSRYNRETLDIRYKGRNIAEVLQMTVEEALEFFHAIPTAKSKLQALSDVGLGYVQLGQSAPTLSGGEAQRVKLAKELARRDTGRTLYIFDEPTTGLHFDDVAKLLRIFFALRDRGNSIVIVEHNLDVIAAADWIIDLGPEGGAGGGRIIATGTPEQIRHSPESHTGSYLCRLLGNSE